MADESLEREIQRLDKSLQLLLGECIENDLCEEKVYRLVEKNVCEKATKQVNQINRTKNLIAFAKVLLATLLCSYLLTRRPVTSDLLKMLGRRMLIGIQPYYDWTEYYDTRCFDRGVRYEEQAASGEPANCNLCESLTGCELLDKAEELNRLTDLIVHHRPAIVRTSKVPDPNPIFNLTLDRLARFYLALDQDKVCMFESNLNYGSAFDLLSQVTSESGFFAHFENCGYSLRKKLRKLYEIPDFMPMMLEFTRENWFLLSQHYHSRNFKRIDVATGTKLAVLVQIAGSTRVRLNPKANCLSACARIEETVNEMDLCM